FSCCKPQLFLISSRPLAAHPSKYFLLSTGLVGLKSSNQILSRPSSLLSSFSPPPFTMTTSEKKTIVVIGATGNQGSSVARTFLSLPHWHVRCLTRNPSSAAAQTLSGLGAELVQGDLSDPASLTRAFASANTIFANTDFW